MLWLQKKKKSSLCKEAPLQLHKRGNAQSTIHRNTQYYIYKTQIHKYTNTQLQIHRITRLLSNYTSDMGEMHQQSTLHRNTQYCIYKTQIHKYINTQIHKSNYTSDRGKCTLHCRCSQIYNSQKYTQIHKYAKHTNTQLHE